MNVTAIVTIDDDGRCSARVSELAGVKVQGSDYYETISELYDTLGYIYGPDHGFRIHDVVIMY